MKFLVGSLLFLIFSVVALAAPQGDVAPLPVRVLSEKPKLVVLIAVDQMRSDYLTRFQSRFLPVRKSKDEVGGFNYLMTTGAYFPFAKYDLAQNMTGPGHATMLTGSYPYQNGVPLNNWYDTEKGESVYCAEDASVPTVGVEKTKPHVGTSPKNLLASTVGDELKNAGYASRVISIALKDRAAIFMGGHRADLALWFDQSNFQWVTSKFYAPDGKLPRWVGALNEPILKSKGEKREWALQSTTETGLALPNSIPPGKENKLGLNFPHAFSLGSNEALSTPLGLTMTREATEKAIEVYKLGQLRVTDLLAVSFSSHDYVGHLFGPNSREAEEMAVAEDIEISKLLNYLQKKVPGGLKNVLIVLTADHGIPPNPDQIKDKMAAGRINEEKLKDKLEQAAQAAFGKAGKEKWISEVRELNVFLNPKALKEKEVSKKKVEDVVKSAGAKQEGIMGAFSSSDYAERKFPPGVTGRQIAISYFPGRSGDVFLIPQAYYMSGEDTVSHMTGYNYDRSVPLIFAGPHIRAGLYASEAAVIDIAPSLSFLLGIVPPTSSEGRVLAEALR